MLLIFLIHKWFSTSFSTIYFLLLSFTPFTQKIQHYFIHFNSFNWHMVNIIFTQRGFFQQMGCGVVIFNFIINKDCLYVLLTQVHYIYVICSHSFFGSQSLTDILSLFTKWKGYKMLFFSIEKKGIKWNFEEQGITEAHVKLVSSSL